MEGVAVELRSYVTRNLAALWSKVGTCYLELQRQIYIIRWKFLLKSCFAGTILQLNIDVIDKKLL